MKERMITFLKGNGMHGLSILVFVVLSVSLLSKSYDGYVVRQGDIENHKGMSREASDHRALVGGIPSMDGIHVCGNADEPHRSKQESLECLLVQVRRMISKPFQSSGVFVFFMAMLSAYLLAIALGASPTIALLCGVGFGLSSFEVLYYAAGHNTKVRAMAYLPGILAGVLWAYRKNVGWGMAIAALYTSLHVHANHYQITYYGLFLIGCVGHHRNGWNLEENGGLETCFAAELGTFVCGHCRGLAERIGSFRNEGVCNRYDTRRTHSHQRRERGSGGCRAWTENTFLNTAWAMVNGGPLCVQTSKEGIVHIIGENKISQVAHCISVPFYVRFSSFFW